MPIISVDSNENVTKIFSALSVLIDKLDIMFLFHVRLRSVHNTFSQSLHHNVHSFSNILPDSVTPDLEPIFVKPRALVPGATLSPVFLSEERRTFGNPISYLGGPRLQTPNMTRASKESVLSVD